MSERPVPVPCKSCAAPLLFARTSGGALSPFDAESDPAGTFVLTLRRGELHADYAGGDEARARFQAEGRNFFTTHFATCPNADEHRRAR